MFNECNHSYFAGKWYRRQQPNILWSQCSKCWWILRSTSESNITAAELSIVRIGSIGRQQQSVGAFSHGNAAKIRAQQLAITQIHEIRNMPWSNIIHAIQICAINSLVKSDNILLVRCHSHCNVMNAEFLAEAKWCCVGMWHFVPDFQAFLDHFRTCCWVCDILHEVVNHFETENVFTACSPCLWHSPQGWQYLRLKVFYLRRS